LPADDHQRKAADDHQGKAPDGHQRQAVAFLRDADPVLRTVIDRVGADDLGAPRADVPDDPYGALVRAIVGQQLSTKAALAIYGRLTARFGGRTPTPEQVLADDPDELRTTVGLSHAKVRYLRSLADHIGDGSLVLERLDQLTDEEVIAELTAVKGLGLWSAHMFLIFNLRREDVLAAGDLGIRRAVMVNYGLLEMPRAPELERIAEPWRPYRTLACRFLWRSLGTAPV
jgi:DNA-3-methyladenine glycosylase II